MTIKEGTPNPCPYKLAKLSPMISSKYYEHLINDKSNASLLTAWDLMMGISDLSSCITSLKKAIDKKNGVPVPDEKITYFHQEIDL